MTQDDLTRVERLYIRLTEALQRTRRAPFDAPVTVAEIYQELVPYRVVRGEAGFDMNADYEHALLQLLAGEGQRLRVEPPHVAEELRRELRGANPNLSLYREYAACDVWVSRPAGIQRAAAPAAHAPPSEAAAVIGRGSGSAAAPRPMRESAAEPAKGSLAEIFALVDDEPVADAVAEPLTERPGQNAPRPAPVTAQPAASRAPSPDMPVDAPAPVQHQQTSPPPLRAPRAAASPPSAVVRERPSDSAPAAEATGAQPAPTAPHEPAASPAEPVAQPAPRATESARCSFCDSALPQGRAARFCPFCGADQSTRPCTECGEVVEPGWVYCIACGAAAP